MDVPHELDQPTTFFHNSVVMSAAIGAAPLLYNLNLSSHSISVPAVEILNTASNAKVAAYSKQFDELLREADWVSDFLNDATTIEKPAEILPFYKGVNRLLRQEKFGLCDTFLAHIQDSSSDLVLVGFLRLTYASRSKLPAWERLLDKALATLASRGHNTEKTLAGLV